MYALTTIALAATEATANPSAGGTGVLSLLAFGLLVASLVVFIISTRQWPLLQRSLIWLGGVIALIVSVFVSSAVGGGRFLSVLGALWKDSGVGSAIGSNFGYIAGYFEPALNVLFVLCIIVGVSALIAFTPGEAIERSLRRFSLTVAGIIVGAVLTLGLVAFGFGGNAKRLVFISVPSLINCDKYEKSQRDPRCDVVDGDTIRMGDISFRIAGINTPEMDEQCASPACTGREGAPARNHLTSLLRGKIVVCSRPRQLTDESSDKPPAESLGRPVVECFLWEPDGNHPNLGVEMVRAGYAKACRKEVSDSNPYWTDILAAQAVSTDPPDGPPRTFLSCPKGEYDADGKKWGPSG
jgi:endonuclease YncB( thermonuclease family)